MGRRYENFSVPKGQKTRWVQPIRRGYCLACCDCGLVHEVDFRVRAGHAQFRVGRDNRATAAMRRHAEPTLNLTFLRHATESLAALYAEQDAALTEAFIKRFRASVRQKRAEMNRKR